MGRSRPDRVDWNVWLGRVVLGAGAALIAVLPAALIYLGLHIRGEVEPIDGGRTAAGIVEFVTGDNGGKGAAFIPTISYADQQQHVHLFEGPADDDPRRVGSHVKVSYDPAHPTHATVVSVGSKGWPIILWSGIGLGTLEVAALAALLRAVVRRYRRRDGSGEHRARLGHRSFQAPSPPS